MNWAQLRPNITVVHVYMQSALIWLWFEHVYIKPKWREKKKLNQPHKSLLLFNEWDAHKIFNAISYLYYELLANLAKMCCSRLMKNLFFPLIHGHTLTCISILVHTPRTEMRSEFVKQSAHSNKRLNLLKYYTFNVIVWEFFSIIINTFVYEEKFFFCKNKEPSVQK